MYVTLSQAGGGNGNGGGAGLVTGLVTEPGQFLQLGKKDHA